LPPGYGHEVADIFAGIVVTIGTQLTQRAAAANWSSDAATARTAMTSGRRAAVFLDRQDSDVVRELAQRHGLVATIGRHPGRARGTGAATAAPTGTSSSHEPKRTCLLVTVHTSGRSRPARRCTPPSPRCRCVSGPT
jgi:hypothetical protein